MKNIPYVKKYNKNGELINPIVKKYVNLFPNRITRNSVQRGKLIYNNLLNTYVKADYRDKLKKLKNNFFNFKKSITEYNYFIIMKLNALEGQYKKALYKASANKQWI